MPKGVFTSSNCSYGLETASARQIYDPYRAVNSHPSTIVSTPVAKFMGPTWGPPGSCRPQMGPMLAPWTLLSG